MVKRSAAHDWSSTKTASPSEAIPPPGPDAPADGSMHGHLEPGVLVDRYEVIELVGQGSMGRVYRARDTALGREVALKWIHPGRSIAQAQARLRREAQAMAKVEHPAVVRIYDVGISVGQLFVAMELARGGTLAAWLKERPRWREVVRVFVEAGRGLAAAHRAGLVHRDIKPRNILLDAHGRAKVSDFGLARTFQDEDDDGPDAVDVDIQVTRTGAIVGTPAYMAPEQLAGDPIDARADQFSFCVALWEALCGQRPFRITIDTARSTEAALEAIRSGAIETPRAPVPRRLLALVRRGLAADRAQRWGSMDELLDALERTRPRRRWLAAVAAVGAAAIALAWPWRADSVSVPCGRRDQVAAVWNAIVHARYLSSAPEPRTAIEDAGWFDWYARSLDDAYAASCGRAAPPRLACLDDAVEDLRAAIARPERELWPRLRAIDRCGLPPREVDIGSLTRNERSRLSADGRELLVYDPSVASIHQLDGSGSRSVKLRAMPLHWLADGTFVTSLGGGQIELIDGAGDHTTRYLGVEGRLLAITSDLRLVAVEADRQVTIRPAGGGEPLADPIATQGMLSPGAFSADHRRFALLLLSPHASHALYIDDLVSRHRTVLAFRLHLYGTGVRGVRWLDPTSLLLYGSAVAGIQGDVWRVRVDAAGRLAEPPQILMRSERDTALEVQDARAGKIVVARISMAAQNVALDGESSSLLPGAGLRLLPREADRTRHRILASTDALGTRWAWMSHDDGRVEAVTSRVEAIPRLDGVRGAVVSPWGLAALDLRADPPAYVAFDDAGAELARMPIEAARGARPALRCGASSCLAMWSQGTVAYTSRIERAAIAPPVRHDVPELARMVGWDVSPDGNLIAGTNVPFDALIVHDLARSVTRVVKRVASIGRPEIQRVRFTPGGALLFSMLSGDEFSLVRRDPAGDERVLWRGTAWIPSVVSLGERRILLSTISWQYRLSMFELP